MGSLPMARRPQVPVVMVAGKGFRSGVFSRAPGWRRTCSQCRLKPTECPRVSRCCKQLDGERARATRSVRQSAVAEPLDVLDVRRHARFATQQLLGDG